MSSLRRRRRLTLQRRLDRDYTKAIWGGQQQQGQPTGQQGGRHWAAAPAPERPMSLVALAPVSQSVGSASASLDRPTEQQRTSSREICAGLEQAQETPSSVTGWPRAPIEPSGLNPRLATGNSCRQSEYKNELPNQPSQLFRRQIPFLAAISVRLLPSKAADRAGTCSWKEACTRRPVADCRLPTASCCLLTAPQNSPARESSLLRFRLRAPF